MVSAQEGSMTREEGWEAGGSLVTGLGDRGQVRAKIRGVGHLGDPKLLVVSLPGWVHEVVVDEVDVLDSHPLHLNSAFSSRIHLQPTTKQAPWRRIAWEAADERWAVVLRDGSLQEVMKKISIGSGTCTL
jgi:hypothetical protein